MIRGLPERVVLATSNPGKRAEWRALLQPHAIILDGSPRAEPPEENGATVRANAVIKARAFATVHQQPALADDVALFVDALGGAPGLCLRRWADGLGGWDASIAYLVEHANHSTATYRCGVALVWPDGTHVATEAETAGTIRTPTCPGVATEPCFVPQGSSLSLASMTEPERAAVHHRHLAWRALIALLAQTRDGP